MKMIRFILPVVFTLLASLASNSQNLIKKNLTASDRNAKVTAIYEHNANDHYASIKLFLYKDGTYKYTLSTFNSDVFSKGKWKKKLDTLVLSNNISKSNLPVKLTYSTDSTNLINGFKIGIVTNLKGDKMPDGLVAINDDSIMCAPSYGICDYSYTRIDSIRVIFENGLSSKWLTVADKEYRQITPVVQIDYLVSSLMVFDERKYFIHGGVLKPLE